MRRLMHATSLLHKHCAPNRSFPEIQSVDGYLVGLQSGALKGELHKPDYKRLNLGVAVAALALTAVRIVHWDLQTSLGHLQTVLQGALTGKSQIPHNAALPMAWPIPCGTTSHWHCAVEVACLPTQH